MGKEYPIDAMAKNLIETFTHPDSIHLGRFELPVSSCQLRVIPNWQLATK